MMKHPAKYHKPGLALYHFIYIFICFRLILQFSCDLFIQNGANPPVILTPDSWRKIKLNNSETLEEAVS